MSTGGRAPGRAFGIVVLLLGLFLLVFGIWQVLGNIAMFGETGAPITVWDALGLGTMIVAGASLAMQGRRSRWWAAIAGLVLGIHGVVWALLGYPTAGPEDQAPNAVWGSAYPWILLLLPGALLAAFAWYAKGSREG
jgi:hypothetical protein